MDKPIEIKTEEPHHKYGPSSLAVFEGCPCYQRDETRDTGAADEGTMLHKATETGDFTHIEDEEQQDCVDFCLKFKSEAIAQFKNPTVIVEQHVVIDGGITNGTFDLGIFGGAEDGFKGIVADWKFGRVPVPDAKDNIQVWAYVLGAFEKYSECRYLTGAVIQPRLNHISSWEFDRGQMEVIRKRIRNIIGRCEDPNKKPHANEKSCTYCGGKGDCVALHQVAQEVSSSLPMPVVYDPGKLVNLKDVSKSLVLASMMEDWAKQVRRVAKTMVIEEDLEIPGFSLRTRTGSFEVVDLYDAIQILLEKHDVDIPNILMACSMSVPKLVTHLTPFMEGTKKENRSVIEEELKRCMVQRGDVSFLQRKRGTTDEKILEG